VVDSAPGTPALDGVDREAPLTNAYRLLRRVAPPESPLRGWLARSGDEETVLLVSAGTVREWPGVMGEPGGHVLAPRDVVRTAEGVCIELDWCGERLDRFLDRRERAGVRLSGGEAVTLAVSVGRGLVELSVARPRGAESWPAGEWWLTESGRPLFVHDAAGTPADAGSREVLGRIARLTESDQVAAAVRHSGDGVIAGHSDEEAALFAVAEPAPVTTVVFEPARARSLDIAAALPPPIDTPSPRGRAARLVERHIDADFAGVVSDAAHSLRVRLRGRRPKPWLLAAGAAALVLIGGGLWPVGADEPATAGPGGVSPSVTATPSASSGPASAGPADLAAITTAVLDERLACGGEASCLDEVLEDARSNWPAGVIDLPAAGRSVTLLDEFGGVAVLRVTATEDTAADGEAAAQLVVIVESNGRWLLRDVHDVAQE
jgi:hypothetical protein